MADTGRHDFERIQDVNLGLKLAEQKLDTLGKSVEETIKELRDIVTSLDKDMAVHEEKQARLLLQIDQLEKSVASLNSSNDKKRDGSDAFIRSVLIALVSGALTYIISRLA